MLMMAPPPLATISRAAHWATRNAERTLSPSSRSRVGSSTSRNGCGRLRPALLTRMSRRLSPAKASRTAFERVTSKGYARTLPPREAISRATSSSSLGVRLTRISSAPAFANVSDMARPMPRPAPVTSAVFPSSQKALSADFAGIGLQEAPHLRAGRGPPARVEIAEPRSEACSISSVDLHASARELFGAGGIDLLDVVTLLQGEFLCVAFDDLLDSARQSAPDGRIGEQGEARPPMRRQAQIGLHLVEPQ